MKVELTPCYILHHRDYKESSLLLEIFAKEHGRLSLVAKGIKRNKKAASYHLYQKYFLSWVAKSELGTLTDIEPAGTMMLLKPAKMMAGFYINEIILRLLHKHESHHELFDAYDKVLQSLLHDQPENIVLRYFEKSLLQSLGYGLVLRNDVVTGKKIIADQDYFYEPDKGPSLLHQDEKSNRKISGQTLLQIDSETLSTTEAMFEAKALFKLILQRYLGDTPLASRMLYQDYMRNKKLLNRRIA